MSPARDKKVKKKKTIQPKKKTSKEKNKNEGGGKRRNALKAGRVGVSKRRELQGGGKMERGSTGGWPPERQKALAPQKKKTDKGKNRRGWNGGLLYGPSYGKVLWMHGK